MIREEFGVLLGFFSLKESCYRACRQLGFSISIFYWSFLRYSDRWMDRWMYCDG